MCVRGGGGGGGGEGQVNKQPSLKMSLAFKYKIIKCKNVWRKKA